MSKVKKNVVYGNTNKFDVDLKTGQLAEAELVEIIGGNKLEVKRDFMASKTGNIAVEYESRGEFSGILTTEAEHYAFVLDNMTIIIETAQLKELMNIPSAKIVTGGDDGTSTMVLIPLSEVIKYA